MFGKSSNEIFEKFGRTLLKSSDEVFKKFVRTLPKTSSEVSKKFVQTFPAAGWGGLVADPASVAPSPARLASLSRLTGLARLADWPVGIELQELLEKL